MKQPIYLDYAATTPADPAVVKAMMECLGAEGHFGNPASRSHRFGWQAEELVDIARNQVADLIGADPREIIWTSGATESDNLAIKGIAEANGKGHIITSAFEHKAVLDCCVYLENKGFQVTYLKPSANGFISAQQVESAIQNDTILITIMMVNNELGSIQPIAEIGEVASKNNILFHVDAAQAAGKIPIDLNTLKVDFMSFSAHKIYAPKGMGVLYARINQQPNITAQIHGGGHERGLRSGTLATHQIVGMGLAFEIARKELQANDQHVFECKQLFMQGVCDIKGISVNAGIEGHKTTEKMVAGIINLQFEGVDSEMLIMAFKDLAISSGSACTSASVEPSYVLKTLGLSDLASHSSLRFSFGRFTTMDEVKTAIEVVKNGYQRLKELSVN
ncbi:MAG: IscS subfamily cysteine desulfurase [Gammaproteobacteria bacterium]|nr:MAG: IscS subfamily cysteine desulfurase [Gammaproteobacteria bacterium]